MSFVIQNALGLVGTDHKGERHHFRVILDVPSVTLDDFGRASNTEAQRSQKWLFLAQVLTASWGVDS